MVKIISFNIAGKCCNQSISIISFSMAGTRHGQNRQFQHGWNVLWSKLSVSAGLENVVVQNISFRMSVMCPSQKLILKPSANSFSKKKKKV
jgi:hypothetical protein